MKAHLAIVALLGGISACGMPPGEIDPGSGEPPPGPGPVEQTQNEISNGQITTARPEVGIVWLPYGCTGTLITDRHVLTAAHCVDYRGLSRGGQFVINKTERFNVARTFSLGNGQTGHADLAVSELEWSVPASLARPAAIAPRKVSTGTMLTVMGYGVGGGWQFGQQKRFRTFRLTGNDRLLDKGDSGGPLFVGALGDNGPIGLVSSATWNYVVYSRESWADPPRHAGAIWAVIDGMNVPGVCYRGHVANVGWLPPVCNGEASTGAGSRDDFQAVQIWDNRTGHQICYDALMDQLGYGPRVCDGDVAGTTGQSRKIETLRFYPRLPGGVRMVVQVMVAGRGWQSPIQITDGLEVGIHNQGLRALRVWVF